MEAKEKLLPLYDEVAKCNKCGFCQAGCPVYGVTFKEGTVARGRIAIYRKVIEDELKLNKEAKEILADCLLCRACVSHCFGAVNTDEIVIKARQTYNELYGQPWIQKTIFRNILSNQERMAKLLKLMFLVKKTGISRLANKMGILSMINDKLANLEGLVDNVPLRFLKERLNGLVKNPKKPKYHIGYFVACGHNYHLPEVGEASVRVLNRNSCKVTVLDNTCCGLPPYGHGDKEAAFNLMKDNLKRLGKNIEEYDAVITECGSCSSFTKKYKELLKDDPEYSSVASSFSHKMRSFSEFISEIGGLDEMKACNATVTYHEPCHMGSRYQDITEQPRGILKNIPGVHYKELKEADWCCGAAGIHNIIHNDISMKILDRKMGNVESSGANIIVTECPGCMIQISHGARKKKLPLEVLNISQILDRAYRNEE